MNRTLGRTSCIAAALLVAGAAGTVPTLGAQESNGTRGIEAARRGGVVIACRHGITDSADENEATLRYDDPATQRRLSAEGERQARRMGEAFRSLQIPVAEVIASPMQRARLTAELMFGRAQLDSAWHTRGEYYGGWKRDARLAHLGQPVQNGNRVIVSHIGTMYSVVPSIRGRLDEGDCAVIRPLGGTAFEVVDVVPWREWERAAARR